MCRDSSKPGRPEGERWVVCLDQFSEANPSHPAEIGEWIAQEFEALLAPEVFFNDASLAIRFRLLAALNRLNGTRSVRWGSVGMPWWGGVEAAWLSAVALSEVL